MKRLIAVALAMSMLLLAACSQADVSETKSHAKALDAGTLLLKAAIDELFLYQGEISVDKSAEPDNIYRSEDGRKYRRVEGYNSIAELRTHSRKVFTEGFCARVLDDWAYTPDKPRFIERNDRLWTTSGVGNMGWIINLVPSTIEVVSLEEDSCVLSAYSQSLLGEVTRNDFLMLREKDGWRLDSYYDFNYTLPEPQPQPTVGEYLASKSGGDSSLYGVTVRRVDGTGRELDESMIPPFEAILNVLEYDPASVTTVEQLPESQGNEKTKLDVVIHSGSYELGGYDDGSVYITAPSGEITQLAVLHPGGITLLDDVINAARWHLKDFLKNK